MQECNLHRNMLHCACIWATKQPKTQRRKYPAALKCVQVRVLCCVLLCVTLCVTVCYCVLRCVLLCVTLCVTVRLKGN